MESLSKHDDEVVVTDSADVVRKQPGRTGAEGISLEPIVDGEAAVRDEARKPAGPSGIAESELPSRRLDVRW